MINQNMINEYSTEEKIIGKWIDGKPLYRKVLSYNIEGNYSGEKDVSSLNISTCINSKSFMIRSGTSNNEDIEGQYHQSDTDYFRTFIRNKTKLQIRSASSYPNINVYIILEYTKTTD